ncbi:hypothetical protein NW801_14295 [Brevibacillus laterosporus]|uniref:Uncharacterized protein n=2 Tax=Brevibacillus TaxID=55080 RepID=A0A0F6Y0F7_BRELA|nr:MULTISPECIES: hypothetical protein [Brevibacillus]AKF95446.1 hypothetical protein EX87_17655 [Brevibacillus laterosporus]MCR8986197.1 hypothetical protein [Brevibacillus laterosporus]MCZ0831930.1 hypothetical protein [Brevibacillus halotolerans]GIO00307.1 hypothetical protein J5TS2_09750 [Brevibacillus halotolerans]
MNTGISEMANRENTLNKRKNKNDLYNYQDQLDELLRREAALALSSAGWAGSNLLDIYLQERKVKRAFRDAYDSE